MIAHFRAGLSSSSMRCEISELESTWASATVGSALLPMFALKYRITSANSCEIFEQDFLKSLKKKHSELRETHTGMKIFKCKLYQQTHNKRAEESSEVPFGKDLR